MYKHNGQVQKKSTKLWISNWLIWRSKYVLSLKAQFPVFLHSWTMETGNFICNLQNFYMVALSQFHASFHREHLNGSVSSSFIAISLINIFCNTTTWGTRSSVNESSSYAPFTALIPFKDAQGWADSFSKRYAAIIIIIFIEFSQI